MAISFNSVYHDFDGGLRKFVRGRVSDSDIVEDILQEVYIKIHDNIDGVRDTNRLTSWIYQITRNTIIDQYRRAHPTFELTEEIVAPQAEMPDVYMELASSVQGMLNCLSPEYRQALWLADLQGMKQEEVAKELGLSLSGAKSRVQRARQKLKQAFLACCHFEFDHKGRLLDFESGNNHCGGHRSQDKCKNGGESGDEKQIARPASGRLSSPESSS